MKKNRKYRWGIDDAAVAPVWGGVGLHLIKDKKRFLPVLEFFAVNLLKINELTRF